MIRGFFGFWWCLAFAALSFTLLIQAIEEGAVGWAWMNGIAVVLWLSYAWSAKTIAAIEEDNDNDTWSPPNGSSKR